MFKEIKASDIKENICDLLKITGGLLQQATAISLIL